MAEEKKSRGLGEMIKLGLVLVAFAVSSCAVLAIVNNFTAPQIAKNKERKVNEAMVQFFPEEGLAFEAIGSFRADTVGPITVDNVYLAKRGSEIVGGAAEVTGPTYDQGTIIVGMKKDGTVTGLQFLKLTDSPGFGLKANDPTFIMPNGKTFYGQFEGKNAKESFVAGKNFDAISGATVTSVGIASLINEGTKALFKLFEEQE